MRYLSLALRDLSLRAKGILLMRQSGFEVPVGGRDARRGCASMTHHRTREAP